MELYPKSITKQCHQKILEQMNEINNSICKINNGEIGLFCKIKYNNKINQVLIINNNVNNDEYINKIKVLINNREEIINIDKILFKDMKQNITIIKIKNNNKNIKYIELDDNLFKKESEFYYNDESIYIIQNKKNETFVLYGVIKEIFNNEIIYKGNVISNYSLIFNLNNNKLIGINKDKTEGYYNKGICFNNIIKRIKNYNNYNEINILVDIKKENLNKKVYYINDNGNDLKELNNYNTELYINNKLEKYKTYIISENIGINNIILKFNYELKNTKNMFRGCINIIEINFLNFNSKYITNMQFMFYKCNRLKNIIFNNFDTINAQDMSYMFYNCSKLNNLSDISKWDTKNVTDMSYMFSGCSSLNNISDISNWNTKNVEYMSYMFNCCGSLNDLPDISRWDTSNVKEMNYMFDGCSSLKNIPKIFLNK